MTKLIMTGCTVELTLPDMSVVDVTGPTDAPRVKLHGDAYVEDAVVRHGDRVIRIPRLLLTKLVGQMPVLDECSGHVILFTTEDVPQPDAAVEG